MASGQAFGRRAGARPRAPRLGQQGAARPDRGRPQERPAAARRRHRPASSSASTWARSTWSSRSSRRRRWPAACSASAAPATRSARSRRACCSPSTAATCSDSRSTVRADARPAQIEALRVPTNPLDVLAQQTVAAVRARAAGRRRLVRRWCGAAPRSPTLPRSAFEATLDLLAGRYPSDEFAELRPRLVWDRDAGTLTGRPGCAAAGGDQRRHHPRPRPVRRLPGRPTPRSRRGSASSTRRWSTSRGSATCSRSAPPAGGSRRSPTTGCSSSPRPGSPARLPFWKGDGLGRPAELGAAVGAFTRELARAGPRRGRRALPRNGSRRVRRRQPGRATSTSSARPPARCRATARSWSSGSATSSATGGWSCTPPTALRCTRRWALAIDAPAARALRHRRQADGLRRRHRPAAARHRRPDAAPGADLFVFDADEIEPIVTAEVGGSALFASRFRECAARALLLPRRDPGKRSPLWQQRQRAAQLLEVARKYPAFPIVLEAVRECLQDVYDVPALAELMRRVGAAPVAAGRGRDRDAVAVRARRCCSATSAQFMYEGDSPLAERRAAALSLDQRCWPSCSAAPSCASCSTPRCSPSTEAELQRLSAGPAGPRRRGRRRPAAAARAADRRTRSPSACTTSDVGGWLDGLLAAKRALDGPVRRPDLVGSRRGRRPAARRPRRAGARRSARGLHRSGRRPARRPGRPVRPHPRPVHHRTTPRPASASACAVDRRRAGPARHRRPGDPRRVPSLGRMPARGRRQWCDAEVLRILRRRSLAALRAQVEPVSPRHTAASCRTGSTSARHNCAASTAWPR